MDVAQVSLIIGTCYFYTSQYIVVARYEQENLEIEGLSKEKKSKRSREKISYILKRNNTDTNINEKQNTLTEIGKAKASIP